MAVQPTIESGESKGDGMELTRRSFLATAALSGVGVAGSQVLASSANSAFGAEAQGADEEDFAPLILEEKDEPDATYESDVVVVGCGPSGVCCATRLAESGYKANVVSKSSEPGGTGLIASGNAYIALDSQFQQDQGFVADKAAFFKEWLQNVHYHCDQAVLSSFINNSGRAVDMMYSYGFEYVIKDLPPTTGLSGNAYRISQPPSSTDIRREAYNKMMEVVLSAGGSHFTGYTAQRLIVNGDGRVVGVRAVHADGTVSDFMGKAVVLATGGYASNRKMVTELSGVLHDCINPVENMGEGCRMAWAAGARVPWNIGSMCLDMVAPVHEDLTIASNLVSAQGGGYVTFGCFMDAPSRALLHVNPSGVRYHNEDIWWTPTDGGNNTVSYWQPYFWVIVDDATMQATIDNEENMITQEYIDQLIGEEAIFVADGIAELAEKAGMDPELFQEEFDAYQEMCRNGEDPKFFKAPEYLVEYGDGPYYAMRFNLTTFGTCGSLSVNEKTQVRAAEGEAVIPGLYATGTETVGTMHNDCYWALGHTCSWSITSGMLCGEQLCRELGN